MQQRLYTRGHIPRDGKHTDIVVWCITVCPCSGDPRLLTVSYAGGDLCPPLPPHWRPPPGPHHLAQGEDYIYTPVSHGWRPLSSSSPHLRIFWAFCINRFCIGPLHYISSRSYFGFKFVEIFVTEKQVPESPSWGVNKIAYRYNFFQTFK